MRRVLILWLLSPVLLAAQNKTASCQSFTLASELAAKARFERDIGSGLSFQVKPTGLGAKGELDGWEIYIVRPKEPEKDYIYPVNLPLRFNGVQILGASYNDDARTSLGQPHEMWFLLSKTDYDKMSPALNNALWPYMSPHPDKVADEFFAALKTVKTGWLKFTVLHYELETDADSVKKMKFQIDFTVPNNFKLAAGFPSRPTTCHAQPQ
jgi:hypothetical protein